MRHQYVDRATGEVRDEPLYHDRLIRLIYSDARERAPALFRAITSRRMTGLVGMLNYDFPLGSRLSGKDKFLRDCGVDLSECLDGPEALDTPRKVFERKIRYWERRPMVEEPGVVASPADARALVGSLSEASALFLKEKFFSLDELLGGREWAKRFKGGDFAVFRLTPDKYHYNHVPASGVVAAIYEADGAYHACNPAAAVAEATPLSKNRRIVTVIDTDAPGGDRVGLVAMIEVVALMIGDVRQAYSEDRYEAPRPVAPGMFLRKGAPKSLYRPGSSTDVLLFEPGRARFWPDLVRNLSARAESRFSLGFGRPLVETDVAVRSPIARRFETGDEGVPGDPRRKGRRRTS